MCVIGANLTTIPTSYALNNLRNLRNLRITKFFFPGNLRNLRTTSLFFPRNLRINTYCHKQSH